MQAEFLGWQAVEEEVPERAHDLRGVACGAMKLAVTLGPLSVAPGQARDFSQNLSRREPRRPEVAKLDAIQPFNVLEKGSSNKAPQRGRVALESRLQKRAKVVRPYRSLLVARSDFFAVVAQCGPNGFWAFAQFGDDGKSLTEFFECVCVARDFTTRHFVGQFSPELNVMDKVTRPFLVT